MKIAILELKLDELIVIYPGETSYYIGQNIKVIGLNEYLRKAKF